MSDEEKADRAQQKRDTKDKEKRKAAPMHISFMQQDNSVPPPRVLPAHEVIELLNTSNQRASIPARSEQASPSRPPRGCVFLDESDDDENAGSNHRTRRHLGNISAEQIVSVMGAYTNVNEYPVSTAVWCHNCSHAFAGIPVMLPHLQCLITKRYEVHGTFCSFNCAKRYALDLNMPRSLEMSALLADMYKRVVGVRRRIVAAPPKIALDVFGGHMPVDEYRRGFLHLPPSDDVDAKTVVVRQLQKNCWPSLARLHVVNEQQIVNEAVLGSRPRTAVSRYDRAKPLRDCPLDGMGMNMRIVSGNAEDQADHDMQD